MRGDVNMYRCKLLNSKSWSDYTDSEHGEIDQNIEKEIIESRLKEILNVILAYSNEVSLEKFNTEISELTRNELLLLKKDFTGIIS